MNNVPNRSTVVHILPNLLTTAGLFAAFYAIVAAYKGQFETAAMAIFVAIVFDIFDGRVARLTDSVSQFGAQYDSMADMVSFGIAPALVLYSWALHRLGKIGWLAAFAYTACTALRLARFNVQPTCQHFQGLPCPAAAACSMALVWHNGSIWDLPDHILMLFTFSLAALMFSNVRYPSFKRLELKGRAVLLMGLLNVVVLIGVALDPPCVLLVTFMIYICSGLIWSLLRRSQAWRLRHRRLQDP